MGAKKGLASPKTIENLIEAYRLWAEELWTVADVARHFHVRKETMLAWLKEANGLWNEELLAGRQLLMARMAIQTQVIARKAHEQFDQSCKALVETTTDADNNKTTKRRGQSGNPAYLSVILAAMERMQKLLGDAAAPTTLGEQLADVPYEHAQTIQQAIANLEGRKRNDQNASTSSPSAAPNLSENGNGERFPHVDFGDDEHNDDEHAGGNELDDL